MRVLILLVGLIVLNGCTTDAGFVFDESKPVTIYIYKSGQITSNEILKPGDEKYKKLLKFFERYPRGWEKSQASYLPNVIIKGENFSLNLLHNIAVLNFVYKNGENGGQFVKEINEDEIRSFL